MSNLVLFYHFYTPVHFGSGATLSYVDLPVERERHTDYPVMPATGIKGVFRAGYQETNKKEKENAEALFGKSDEEGGLIFTDGKILFFPVKSARRVFVWITCPFVLERFEREMQIVDNDFKLDLLNRIKFDNDEQAYVSDDSVLVNGNLILEELSFQKKEKFDTNFLKDVDSIDNLRIAVITDNMFEYFVKNSTEINARIRIDQTKGTVEEGALWYEELVPAETLFYNLILERANQKDLDKIKCFKDFIINHKGIFQFGGDETLGRGFAKVSLFKGGN